MIHLIPNKMEDVNFKAFNMIEGTNESKTLVNIFRMNVDMKLMVKICSSK